MPASDPTQIMRSECNCGFGGFHDDINPRCNLNQPGAAGRSVDDLSDETLALLCDERPGISHGMARQLRASEVVALAREVLRGRAVEAELRALHHARPLIGWDKTFCAECDDAWPCATVRVLDGTQ